MKKGLISLIAGAAVLAGGLAYKKSDDRKVDAYLAALKETAALDYQYQKSSSKEDLKRAAHAQGMLTEMQADYGAMGLEEKLRERGLLHFEENGSTYLGKILEQRQIGGVNAYITTSRGKDFKGIKPLEHFLDGVESITVFEEGNDYAINIDISRIEEDGKKIAGGWGFYVQNNIYMENNDKRWNPGAQALYHALKGVPKNKLAEEYLSRGIENALVHEHQHVLDMRKGGYSIVDKERRALLKELMKSPQILSALENLSRGRNGGKIHERYGLVSRDILNSLMRICKAKDKRDFYLKLSKGEVDVSGGASILWQIWYHEN